MTFLEFATKYKIVSNKLVEQSKNIIRRVFPTYSSNSKSPTFWLYCKYQLLQYKPWTKKPENAWGNTKENGDVCISEWKSFSETEYAKIPNLNTYSPLTVLMIRAATAPNHPSEKNG